MFGHLRSITKERNLWHRLREHFGGWVHCMVHSHGNQKGGQECPQVTQPSFPCDLWANPSWSLIVAYHCLHLLTKAGPWKVLFIPSYFPILFLTCSISCHALWMRPCICSFRRASAGQSSTRPSGLRTTSKCACISCGANMPKNARNSHGCWVHRKMPRSWVVPMPLGT